MNIPTKFEDYLQIWPDIRFIFRKNKNEAICMKFGSITHSIRIKLLHLSFEIRN